MAEQGERFGVVLKDKLAGLAGAARTALIRKIEVVRDMTTFCRSVPDQWNEHERLGTTAKGLAVHAMNLDIDVGPAAADPEAARLGHLRAPQGLRGRR